LERTAAANAEMGAWRLSPPGAGFQQVEQAGGDAVTARFVQTDAHAVSGNGEGDIDPLAAMVRQTVAAGADFGDGEFHGGCGNWFSPNTVQEVSIRM
jgi:hypothetical protein